MASAISCSRHVAPAAARIIGLYLVPLGSGGGWTVFRHRSPLSRSSSLTLTEAEPVAKSVPNESVAVGPQNGSRTWQFPTRFYSTATEERTEKVSSEGKKEGEGESEPSKPIDERTQILEGALAHVNELGWSEAAMAEAAKEAGLSQSVLGLFPRKEAELVEYFMEASKHALSEELKKRGKEFEGLPARQKLVAAIRERLELQAAYVSTWPQALSIQARAHNVPRTLQQRWELADALWEAVGGEAREMERHPKRLLLTGAYSAAEVYMLTDFSPGYEDTWQFLERQVDCVLDVKKTMNEVSHVAQAVGTGLANSFASLLKGHIPKSPFP